MLGMSNNDGKLLDLFLEGAEISYKSAEELCAITDELNNSEQHFVELSRYREEANSIMWSIKERTVELFPPPFENEYLSRISRDLYEFTYNIEKAALVFYTHCITQVSPEVEEVTQKLSRAAQYTVDTFSKLSQSKKSPLILNSISEVNKTAEEAKLIYNQAIKKIFENNMDELSVLKGNSLYIQLEDCINSSRKLAKDLHEVMS